jgi:hypothetical protein
MPRRKPKHLTTKNTHIQQGKIRVSDVNPNVMFTSKEEFPELKDPQGIIEFAERQGADAFMDIEQCMSYRKNSNGDWEMENILTGIKTLIAKKQTMANYSEVETVLVNEISEQMDWDAMLDNAQPVPVTECVKNSSNAKVDERREKIRNLLRQTQPGHAFILPDLFKQNAYFVMKEAEFEFAKFKIQGTVQENVCRVVRIA